MPLQASDPVVEAAIFGKEVEQWLDTRIGAYLVRKAQDEASKALEALAEVDPEDAKAIRALQNKVQVSDSIIGWLGEAVRMGIQATDQLREDA
jgi:hypothetical protein